MVAGERHHAEALRDQVTAVLAPLGLRLAPQKTRTVHIDEGLVFLGFAIRRMRKRGTARQYVYATPSRKAIQAIKDKVKAENKQVNAPSGPGSADPGPQPVPAGLGGLLPVRGVQGRVQRHQLPRAGLSDALDTGQVQGQAPARDERIPPPLLRQRLADRP